MGVDIKLIDVFIPGAIITVYRKFYENGSVDNLYKN